MGKIKLSLTDRQLQSRSKEELTRYIKHVLLNAGMVYKDLDQLGLDSKDEMVKQLKNDLKYTILPPWTHHTKADLKDMDRLRPDQWYKCGYNGDSYWDQNCACCDDEEED